MNIQKLSKALPAAAVILMAGLTVSCQQRDNVINRNDNVSLSVKFDIRSVSQGTKAAPVTSANIITERDNDISVKAYLDAVEYIPVSKLQFDSWKTKSEISYWTFANGKTYNWPSSPLRFFAWSPSEAVTPSEDSFDTEKGIMKMEYTVPSSATEGQDAVDQPDLLFASTLTSFEDNSGIAHLHFNHALAAVNFEIGRNPGVVVKSITLDNVLSSGNVEYDPSDPSASVRWTEIAEPTTYTQSFGESGWPIKSDFKYQEQSSSRGQRIGDENVNFMLIPQKSGVTGSDPIKLTIVFEQNSEEVTFETLLDAEDANWQPGKEYTYVLSEHAIWLLVQVKVNERSDNNAGSFAL